MPTLIVLALLLAAAQLRLLQQLESTSGNTVVLGMPSNSTPLPLRSEPADGPRGLEPGSTPAADAHAADDA